MINISILGLIPDPFSRICILAIEILSCEDKMSVTPLVFTNNKKKLQQMRDIMQVFSNLKGTGL